MVQQSCRERMAYFFVTALALSIGWGIRGNFGHEYGAMIPGALAAMAVVLLSGRSDWLARSPSSRCLALWGGRSAAVSRTCKSLVTRTPGILLRCSMASRICS